MVFLVLNMISQSACIMYDHVFTFSHFLLDLIFPETELKSNALTLIY